jgi:hypothetical protein
MDAVESILNFGAKHDLLLDVEDARLYLANREALARNPDDPEAQRIARHFECVFYIVPDKDKFFEGLLNAPQCPNDCPECEAHDARYVARVIAEAAQAPSEKIKAKCRRYFRPATAPEEAQRGWKEGMTGFLKRTGLTMCQIEKMSDEELARYA